MNYRKGWDQEERKLGSSVVLVEKFARLMKVTDTIRSVVCSSALFVQSGDM